MTFFRIGHQSLHPVCRLLQLHGLKLFFLNLLLVDKSAYHANFLSHMLRKIVPIILCRSKKHAIVIESLFQNSDLLGGLFQAYQYFRFFCCNFERIITKTLAKERLECHSLDSLTNSPFSCSLELAAAFDVVVVAFSYPNSERNINRLHVINYLFNTNER